MNGGTGAAAGGGSSAPGRRTGALGKVVRAGIGRRRVQTVVVTLTVLMAVSSSVLATELIVASDAPFDHAFARQQGAHLTARFDGAKVTAARLGATARVPGVTAAAGPFPTAVVRPRVAAVGANTPDIGPIPAGVDLPPLTVAGRADAGGPVDRVTLLTGRWAARPGEIVVDTEAQLPMVSPGARLRFPELPGRPTLTVVGTARSVSRSADAWVTPAELPALNAPGAATVYEMLYRFASAGTDARMSAARAAIAAAVPADALTGAQSYLAVKQEANATTAAYVPFVAAFGVLGLAMSALIIGVVVSGAVGAATRRIGILKALGFTPSQVVRAYLGQALIPATVGVGLGVLLGDLLAVPVLHQQANAYGVTAPSVALWVDGAVAATALAMVAGAALVPALRAGRLRTVEAIAVGRTPRARRGRAVQRLTGRLRLPRAVSLGLANPFARPARSSVLAAAVGFGAVGVTFALGLGMTLQDVQAGRNRDSVGAVVVEPSGPSRSAPGPSARQAAGKPDPAAVAAAIAAQPGTRRSYSTAQTELSVSGITKATPVVAYQGDSSWAAYQMISGTWLRAPGQAVVGTRFLHAAGVHLGDTVTLSSHGRSTTVRIVGEALNLHDEGMSLLTEASSLAGLRLDLPPSQFNVDLKPGTDIARYLATLNAALAPSGAQARANITQGSDVIATMEALIATLTLILVAVAGLGVLNTVVLDTRERVHELGVYKALGMTPRQTITVVITSVTGIGLIAGVVGVPGGIALHHYVIPLMGRAAGTGIPHADIAVYHLPELIPLAFGGLVIAAAGALLPAVWAARTRTATALRTE